MSSSPMDVPDLDHTVDGNSVHRHLHRDVHPRGYIGGHISGDSVGVLVPRPRGSSDDLTSQGDDVAAPVRVRFVGTRAKVRKFVRREHEPVRLRTMIVKSLLTAITMPICFVGSLTFCAMLGVPTMTQVPGPHGAAPVEQPNPVEVMVDKHGCWSGPAPMDMQGKTPGHAVVTWPGHELPTYGASRAVNAGLEHVFEDKHPLLRVHAFCR